ncbi:MAG: GTPase HflX [Akkermansiaceae bacterium]|jgi:GTPase|nr:GTPase HflX [Akkermansiaceae bacterium]MDP4646358.1 GTPase HflX [Akkermansiaceae bacterium]MDP4721951.1 GTPase HflX [Akkermansiaceae bacterium]MDP4779961.1 GTPase HflX [Akkermansiaceae bacterium]MDP4847113.1 GTPase HflX [Akkermansiaceae bacterium]
MFEVRQKPEMVERALLVRFYFDSHEEDESASLLTELGELVSTLGIEVVDSVLSHPREMKKKFLCGTGKAAEIVELAKAHECDVIVFDNNLFPSQQREWERLADLCVIDREEVILDIFAKRAQTREARLQVELARMQYALPRLARMWGHLDRESAGSGGSGGGGASRGMGEKQIEVDRRLAHQNIDRCKRELEVVRKQRKTQRKEREKMDTPHGSIVGYTNAGKSTLLNILSGSDVMAKDMLFATLDTTTRRIELPDGQPLLITDTVGFVRNLPHRLVEAFKATLEESVLSDFLIHVLDATAPEILKFQETTLGVLEELGAVDKPIITVLNKIDLVEDPETLDFLDQNFPGAIRASSLTGEGLDDLLRACAFVLADRVSRRSYRIPQKRGDLLNLLHSDAKVLSTEYEMNDILVSAVVPAAIAGRLESFLIPA